MKKENGVRGWIYGGGLLILALGITLTTKSGLGISPIISVPYAVSQLSGWNFGNMTFLFYGVLVLAQWVLRGKAFRAYDWLQLVLSLVFTRFLNLFSACIPMAQGWRAQFGVLLAGIVLTGIGAAMSVDVRLIPNPGDGIVQALADRFRRELGFCKNVVDLSCVALTIIVSLLFAGKIVGIGIGTICAMVLTGRVIWLFNRQFRLKILIGSGLRQEIKS